MDAVARLEVEWGEEGDGWNDDADHRKYATFQRAVDKITRVMGPPR